MPENSLRDRLRHATAEPLPLPGSGRTWARWSALLELGADDLALAKVVEPHHDAHAVLVDLDGPWDADGTWAVWAAEPPFAVTRATRDEDGWVLEGVKAFCSGADLVDRALVTALDEGTSRLFAISFEVGSLPPVLDAPGWVGPGMAAAGTRTVDLHGRRAQAVGEPGDYVDRPGFWHGAMGVAACWLGGARAVAAPLERAGRLDDHGLAHRGQVRVALHQAETVLRDAARRVDADPVAPAEHLAHCVRATVADCVDTVVRHVGRALGPGPLAFDEAHARRVADLEVFVRQHHAERDLARLGSLDAP
ncbi:hypothetical protein ASD11_09975 [Aeromicrobium sp. Root495]|uniref:hypothetical protein n=1 Tax=Aeromicrobium sp. Root495 TaxID=1736550 RepID=UPI0006F229A8|nr:hypothetical protein [Aeromicrobium sp. Root495]KQY59842.1 hypothetical protein ASD11_09975 [Aeromicrobium sp. Root495]